MELEFGFGTTKQSVTVPDGSLREIIVQNSIEFGVMGEDAVKAALSRPIGAPRLRDAVRPGEKIVIVTSDITRPMPTYKVMPSVLDELYAAGADRKDITLVFALGSHRSHTEEEKKKLAGERAYSEIRCVDSAPSEYVHYGVTSRGTPVDIMKEVAEADKRICLGNIEYHWFAGFSGGAKAIMPGVSTREAIQANHSQMTSRYAHAGCIDENPIRMDIEEAAAMVGVDYIVNVVLDEHKQIVYAVAGDVKLAHREGCRYLAKLYSKEIEERADIVLVSQGGAPKDLNLYQTQKALDNAKHAVKKGGTIILIGSCREGLGEKTFESWMLSAETSHSIVERIQTDFKLGGHKAAAIAMVLDDAEIYLVSEMDPELVRHIFMTPFSTVQEAFDAAMKKHGPNASVIAMPFGGSTLPHAKK